MTPCSSLLLLSTAATSESRYLARNARASAVCLRADESSEDPVKRRCGDSPDTRFYRPAARRQKRASARRLVLSRARDLVIRRAAPFIDGPDSPRVGEALEGEMETIPANLPRGEVRSCPRPAKIRTGCRCVARPSARDRRSPRRPPLPPAGWLRQVGRGRHRLPEAPRGRRHGNRQVSPGEAWFTRARSRPLARTRSTLKRDPKRAFDSRTARFIATDVEIGFARLFARRQRHARVSSDARAVCFVTTPTL